MIFKNFSAENFADQEAERDGLGLHITLYCSVHFSEYLNFKKLSVLRTAENF